MTTACCRPTAAWRSKPTMDAQHVAQAVALHGQPAARLERAVHDGDGDQDAVRRPRVSRRVIHSNSPLVQLRWISAPLSRRSGAGSKPTQRMTIRSSRQATGSRWSSSRTSPSIRSTSTPSSATGSSVARHLSVRRLSSRRFRPCRAAIRSPAGRCSHCRHRQCDDQRQGIRRLRLASSCFSSPAR